MRKSVIYLFATLPALGMVVGSAAQCPTILNCPQGAPSMCDISGNDPLFWNEPPHTWSYFHEAGDLFEGSVDFSIKILPCNGGGSVSVSYVLLLDLNGDNLPETAVPSNNPPPAGKVYANNAFNPGYTGGDLVVFDKRPVPDSLKFRFALEINISGDTVVAHLRWSSGSSFVSPRLPESKHHLVWRVQQGSIVKYCEHDFRVKDCLAPGLECQPGVSVNMDSSGTATLSFGEVVLSAEDNATPFDLLLFSMRKAGDGSGFPVGNGNSPVSQLIFDCEEIGEHAVELWVKDRSNNTTSCETTLTVTDDEEACLVPPVLRAKPFWSNSDTVQLVAFKMIWVDTNQQLVTAPLPSLPNGCAELNFLPPASMFSLLSEKDTNHLNGVSTFDLLLITKHILEIQTLDAPWKWIAADANKSGSVSTFDVVELRRLLLGIYDKLPNNTSWRFFAADCEFPPNPFSGYCPSEYSFQTAPLWNYPAQIMFNAVKIGDVNGSAGLGAFGQPAAAQRGDPAFVTLPDLMLQRGETTEISLCMDGPAAWFGFQLALQVDPDVLEIESIEPRALPEMDENAWAQPQPGRINLSWFNTTPQAVLPDESLLKMRVKALQTVALRDVVALAEQRISPEGYAADETVRSLQLRFAEQQCSVGPTSIFLPQPNPTTAGAVLPLRLAQAENVRVEITDLSGKLHWFSELPLESGAQMLEIPASAFPQAGVYVWLVKAGETVQTGRIVRM